MPIFHQLSAKKMNSQQMNEIIESKAQVLRIIIVTPTRNEENTIRTTIECMIKQTVLPVKWVIVNDGSTDGTEKIILQYINSRNPFIEYVALPNRGFRKPGQGVVEVFYEGLKKIDSI